MDTDVDKPTLRLLLRRGDLALRLALDEAEIDAGALDRPLRWVHSSDLADPTPFLSEGLVLLTTGTQFADGFPFDTYVARLASRGVLGLGFGTEVVREGIPAGLADACRASGVPLFEVPYRTPFIAIARAGAEAIAAQAYARRSWALSAQRSIALAALRPDGLGATLAELARQLGAWVGLFDAAGSLSRQHPSHGLEEETLARLHTEVDTVLRRGARAGWSLSIGDTPFTLQTLGRGGHLRGVVAIARGDLDQEGRTVLNAVIAMAGLVFEQQEGMSRAQASLRTALMRMLFVGQQEPVVRISRDLWGPLPTAPLVVALTDAAATRIDAVAEQLELRVDEHPGSLFFGAVDDGLLIVVPGGGEQIVVDLADRFGLRVGLSDPTGWNDLAPAEQQARVARDAVGGAAGRVAGGAGGAAGRGAAGRGPADGGSVLRYADIARNGVLAVLATDEARTLARTTIEAVLRYDDEHDTELVTTLRMWLAGDGSNEACARGLGVHRHTVRARIALAERVLGRDLTTFDHRAELWAALRALS